MKLMFLAIFISYVSVICTINYTSNDSILRRVRGEFFLQSSPVNDIHEEPRKAGGHGSTVDGYDVTIYRNRKGNLVTRIVGNSVTEREHIPSRVIGEEDIVSNPFGVGFDPFVWGGDVTVYRNRDGNLVTRIVGDSVTEIEHTSSRGKYWDND